MPDIMPVNMPVSTRKIMNGMFEGYPNRNDARHRTSAAIAVVLRSLLE